MQVKGKKLKPLHVYIFTVKTQKNASSPAAYIDPSPQNAHAGDIDATHLFDYTARAQDIRSDVKNISSASGCCDYTYQILDKYCASLSSVSSTVFFSSYNIVVLNIVCAYIHCML